jgi:phosphatidylinositol 3-kinase
MDSSDPRESLTELAERVAGGRWEEPEKNVSYKTARIVAPCPRLPNLLTPWHPLDALLFCVQMHQIHYQSDQYRPLQGQNNDPLQTMLSLRDTPFATEMTMTFLLQFLSVICIPLPTTDSTAAVEDEEKKTEEVDASQKQAKELTSLLLKLSRRDEGYCQRLYFLLRSFISSLETRRPAAGSKNLLALMNCLELLRFAEKELSVSPKVRTRLMASSSPSQIVASKKDEDKKRSLPFLRKKKDSKSKANTRPEVTKTAISLPEMSSPGGTPTSVVSLHSGPREHALSQNPSIMYDQMSEFLTQLDRICGTVERSLQKSFRQKIADWAMQPWSASKDTALANVTKGMRDSLAEVADNMLLVNPVESSELLSSVDTEECYILPSAHFPILLTFDVSERRASDSPEGEERIYRTTVEFVNLHHTEKFQSDSYVVHAAVGGKINQTDPSRCIDQATTKHSWFAGNKLVFDSRSSWGAPQTLSVRVSPKTESVLSDEVRFGWLDLKPFWDAFDKTEKSHKVRKTVDMRDPCEQKFDEQGFLPDDYRSAVKLEMKITTECVEFDQVEGFSRKRMLLYKHDDDLRQEAFAVQFIQTCDRILKGSGLDMKLLTFQCVPVGTRRGFVQWIPGSVPLSEVCQPFLGSILETQSNAGGTDERQSSNVLETAGLTKYESLRRLGGQQSESFQRLAGGQTGKRGTFSNNPIADYLRSVAYDPEAPYLIRRDVMDTYVKSCAGYSVITYILGVGDRHLDNLLLHQSGAFFHCDYSFLLGRDPKKYVPLRITEDMVHGMGGIESDNYAKFLSLASAAFLALRRPEIVRVLLSMIRLMEASSLPDITENQSIEEAIMGVRDRLRLDLTDDEAVAYMEELIESSLHSKIWIAVDAIHNLGKKF